MNKLIKAEWYRIRKSGTFFIYMITILILTFSMMFLVDRSFFQNTLNENALSLIGFASGFYPMLVGTIVSVTASMAHHAKIAYYEVMDGNKTSHILLSKHIVYLAIAMTLFIIPTVTSFAFCYIKNGAGEMQEPLWFFVLFTLILFRIVISAVNIAMSTKKLIVCAIFGYIRSFLETMIVLPFMMIGDIKNNQSIIDFGENLKDIFIPFQIEKIAAHCHETKFVIAVIASAVIDIVLGYFIAYRSYKRKQFN